MFAICVGWEFCPFRNRKFLVHIKWGLVKDDWERVLVMTLLMMRERELLWSITNIES